MTRRSTQGIRCSSQYVQLSVENNLLAPMEGIKRCAPKASFGRFRASLLLKLLVLFSQAHNLLAICLWEVCHLATSRCGRPIPARSSSWQVNPGKGFPHRHRGIRCRERCLTTACFVSDKHLSLFQNAGRWGARQYSSPGLI